jgi:hypothetical protein
MSRSIGQGYIVSARCHHCDYDKSDLWLGMTAFADGRPSINHVVAYDKTELISMDRSEAQGRGLQTISDPLSKARWRCPSCSSLSLEFSDSGAWFSD